LQSELNQRLRGGLNLQASHVWAKSLGNVGGDAPTTFNPEIIYGTPVANRFDLSADRGNPIPSGPVGNCGVGILEGPGTTTIAAGLSKNFHITERLRLRFEGTFTNLLNHSNFAPPPTNITASSFGQVQSVQTAENSGNRTGQLSLRLGF
jgi:hypothetical protein